MEKKLKTTSCYVDSTSKSLPRLTVPEAQVPGLEDLYIEYIFGKGGLAMRAKVGTETQCAKNVWESLKRLRNHTKITPFRRIFFFFSSLTIKE